jgi:hypothetical protein
MSASEDAFLVEISRVGAWRRVAVLDPVSGREAVVHGPLQASEADLVGLARRRLARRSRSPNAAAGPGRLV